MYRDAEARKEKEAILKEARELKEQIIAEARDKANLDTQKSIEQARQQIQAEKTAVVNEMKKQLAELSVSIAEKVIKKELSISGEQEKMVNGLIDEIKLN